MTGETIELGNRPCRLYAQPRPDAVLLQPVDEHDLNGMDAEAAALSQATGRSFLLCALPVEDWFRDLSPWPAPAPFGGQAFGSGAAATLQYIQSALLPALKRHASLTGREPKILGGYSLAGLFALWCGQETDLFHGIAAASPSVWFPGFLEKAREKTMGARRVYLSLGDREEKTRNPVMASVGSCIRSLHAHYSACPQLETTLEWNAGNHFQEPEKRMAKAFAWVLASDRL